jgi:hypothetical protein
LFKWKQIWSWSGRPNPSVATNDASLLISFNFTLHHYPHLISFCTIFPFILFISFIFGIFDRFVLSLVANDATPPQIENSMGGV